MSAREGKTLFVPGQNAIKLSFLEPLGCAKGRRAMGAEVIIPSLGKSRGLGWALTALLKSEGGRPCALLKVNCLPGFFTPPQHFCIVLLFLWLIRLLFFFFFFSNHFCGLTLGSTFLSNLCKTPGRTGHLSMMLRTRAGCSHSEPSSARLKLSSLHS